MFEKKNEMKFTILFSQANPDHIFAANKLNTQSRNNKANYVAQAIRFYEENGSLDKNAIEKTVLDILNKQGGVQKQSTTADSGQGDGIDGKLKENINNSLMIFKHGGQTTP